MSCFGTWTPSTTQGFMVTAKSTLIISSVSPWVQVASLLSVKSTWVCWATSAVKAPEISQASKCWFSANPETSLNQLSLIPSRRQLFWRVPWFYQCSRQQCSSTFLLVLFSHLTVSLAQQVAQSLSFCLVVEWVALQQLYFVLGDRQGSHHLPQHQWCSKSS